jgi:hypothetical protein
VEGSSADQVRKDRLGIIVEPARVLLPLLTDFLDYGIGSHGISSINPSGVQILGFIC